MPACVTRRSKPIRQVCPQLAEGDMARLARARLLSSRPEEFHLRALPEPYVNLSIHTAPDVRPLP